MFIITETERAYWEVRTLSLSVIQASFVLKFVTEYNFGLMVKRTDHEGC
jgi:hypothetical protein